MYKNKRRRKIILGGLLCLLLIMTIGYSAFSSKLEIKGSSMVTSKWDIEITDLQVKNTLGEAEDVSHSFDTLTANMEADFYSPGDEITYEVTVSNLGTLDAVLDNIKINMDSQDIIQFKVDGITSGEELKQGTSTKFDLIMKYNENITSQPGETSISFSMDLNYLQKGNSSNFADANTDTSDTLAITGINLTPTETSVEAEINANTAIKYYYSLDNDKWYEIADNMYTIYHLIPFTDYTMYIKAEDVNGEVVFSSKAFKTLDNTNPELKLTVGNNTEGNNGWYKGLDINIEASDLGGIASSKYCVSSNDTCTPNTDLALTDGKGTYQFASSANEQTLCVLITDRKGNETSKCTEAYKVDSNEPTITNMTLEPLEDTMTITLETSDEHSGVVKYYYSKDNGSSYIESSSPNYTFVNLDEGDYLVTAYVEDEAGNISESEAKSTNIRYTTFCKQNGIDNLSDCVIATEMQEANVEAAKQEIEAKGAPDFTVTSPAIVYSESHATNTSTRNDTTYHNIANSYTFNPTTGYYTLSGYTITDPETVDFSNGKDYYTCISTNTRCTTLYKITGFTTSTNSSTGTKTYKMTYYPYTARVNSYDNTGTGMYATTDDDGTSYYYRGAVAGNYVKMADKYWRIIRVNGDGTLRLIYDGTSGHANGESSSNRQVGTSAFNSWWSDNAYVGYMYGDPSDNQISEANVAFTYTGLNPSSKYYFGTSYTFDKGTNTFKLSGDLVEATLSEYRDKYNTSGYYTCFSTSSTGTCQRLSHVQKYVSATSMSVKAVEWSSTSYAGAHANEKDSNMKMYLENWYKNNLTSVDNIISKDTVFCNNREVSTYKASSYVGEGYGVTPTMYSYPRFYEWAGSSISPDLSCPQSNDRFSVTNIKGNGLLSNPVGLITADEVSMAGGRTSSQNTLYYLYTGTNYWTMTPPLFYYSSNAYEFNVTAAGALYGAHSVYFGYGVRPVVNLNTDNLTFTGVGTMQDPYVIE